MDEKTLLVEYAQLKDKYEYAKREFELAEERMKSKEQTIVAMLFNRGAETTARYEGIGYARLRKPEIKTANYPKEEEETFFNYVKEKGYGETIKLSIHPTTLRSIVKQLLEEGETLPKYLYYEMVQKITLYGRKKQI